MPSKQASVLGMASVDYAQNHSRLKNQSKSSKGQITI